LELGNHLSIVVQNKVVDVFCIAKKYVQKDGIVWSHGFPKLIKIIQTLYDWQLRSEKLGTGEPDDKVQNNDILMI